MSIRLFSFPADFEATLALWQTAGPGVRVGRSDAPSEIAKKLTRDPDLFLVAEDAGEIVGAVIGGFDGRRGMIYHLAVAASHRGRGLGAALMQELETRLKAKGCVRAYLFVIPDNTDSLAFYEHHGWQKMTVLPMGKDL